MPWRREVLAVCAVTIVAGHLVLAPVTLVAAIMLAAAGRAIRWRPWWLLCPAAGGLAWVLATGPGAAVARFTAWPSGILGLLIAGHRTVRPGHPLAVHLAWLSLPGQLPVALICGATEAAVLGWLDWLHTDAWAVPPRRAGLLALVRGRLTGAAIRAGAVLTRDGCALGVTQATGAIAGLHWAEMAGGLLIAGDDSRDVTLASLQVVHAALRRRKPLFVFDHGAESATGRALTAACLATGTPLRTNGSAAVSAPGVAGAAGVASAPERARSADDGRLATGWRPAAVGTGPGGARTSSPDGAGGADPADMARGTGGTSASGHGTGGGTASGHGTGGGTASGLWGRARGGLAESSRDARSAETVVDPHQVIMERSAALLPADSAEAAARACADLAALAQHLRVIGVDGDGLIWIPRGDLVPAPDLAALLRDAPAVGLPVLISVTSPAAAADLADLVGTAVVLRVTDTALTSLLADLTGVRMVPAQAAAALAGSAGAGAGPWPSPGMPGMPAMPAVSAPPPAPLHGVSGVRPAAPAQPAMPAVPGVTALPGADLVRCPVVSPRTLQTLRRGEFVLAVNVPRSRLIATGRLIPARLPRRAEPPHWSELPHWGKPPLREEPSYREEPPVMERPPYREESRYEAERAHLAEPPHLDESLRREESPSWRAPEAGGR